MFTRTLKVVAVGALLAGGFTLPAGAWVGSSHREYLTFSQPVSLPGVTLAAGTYVFEMPSDLSPDIVSVLSRDGSKVYVTQFTLQVNRPSGGGDIHVSLGERARDAAAPIRAWFPIGEKTGRQFIY